MFLCTVVLYVLFRGTPMTTQPPEAVLLRSLVKSFGEWPVLWNLDLSVPWGQALVLFGANGAGKTTLLRILATHVKADHGSVVLAGHNLRTRPENARHLIGVVGHRSLLYDDLTCRENLIYYSRLFGLKDYKPRVDEVLAKVRLGDRADHRVRTLSNGMQKRASIARAILHQPDVLLLDEPETGLDRESVSILGMLLAEWTDSGRSVVMTTHDLDLGLSWGHRAGVLRGGKINFPDAGFADTGSLSKKDDVRQAIASALESG